ncbi:Aste57867_8294 [Aphanomyces stellatus]|uniref:Aste57867_8294 protein n=1 Tax=Aphanomyces stellatus TaxID=120398 RepID=A0A485KJU5_9STRA|nr:hypothetical protein As57867_008263 [Aphanomyces stellatus]VFT85181.1 Aste57867_8294 [Aphanomyces stellatus]
MKLKTILNHLELAHSTILRIATHLPQQYVVVFSFGTHKFGLQRRLNLTEQWLCLKHKEYIDRSMAALDNIQILNSALDEVEAFLSENKSSRCLPVPDICPVPKQIDEGEGNKNEPVTVSCLEGFWRAEKDEETKDARKALNIQSHREDVNTLFQELVSRDCGGYSSNSDDSVSDESDDPESCDTEWEHSDSEGVHKKNIATIKDLKSHKVTELPKYQSLEKRSRQRRTFGTKRTAHIWQHYICLEHKGKKDNHVIEPKVMISKIPDMKDHLLKCPNIKLTEEDLKHIPERSNMTTELAENEPMNIVQTRNRVQTFTNVKSDKVDKVQGALQTPEKEKYMTQNESPTCLMAGREATLQGLPRQRVSKHMETVETTPSISQNSSSTCFVSKKSSSKQLVKKRKAQDIIIVDDEDSDEASFSNLGIKSEKEKSVMGNRDGERQIPRHDETKEQNEAIKATMHVSCETLGWAYLKGFPWLPVYVLNPFKLRSQLHLLGDGHHTTLMKAQQKPNQFIIVYYFGTHNFGLHTNPANSIKHWNCNEHSAFLEGFPKEFCKDKAILDELHYAIMEAKCFDEADKSTRLLPYMVPSDMDMSLIPPIMQTVQTHSLGWAVSQGYPWMPIFVCDPFRLRPNLRYLGNDHRFILEKAKTTPNHVLVYYFGSHHFGLHKLDSSIKPWDCPEIELYKAGQSDSLLFIKPDILDQFKVAMSEVNAYLSLDESNRVLPHMDKSDMISPLSLLSKLDSDSESMGSFDDDLVKNTRKRLKYPAKNERKKAVGDIVELNRIDSEHQPMELNLLGKVERDIKNDQGHHGNNNVNVTKSMNGKSGGSITSRKVELNTRALTRNKLNYPKLNDIVNARQTLNQNIIVIDESDSDNTDSHFEPNAHDATMEEVSDEILNDEIEDMVESGQDDESCFFEGESENFESDSDRFLDADNGILSGDGEVLSDEVNHGYDDELGDEEDIGQEGVEDEESFDEGNLSANNEMDNEDSDLVGSSAETEAHEDADAEDVDNEEDDNYDAGLEGQHDEFGAFQESDDCNSGEYAVEDDSESPSGSDEANIMNVASVLSGDGGIEETLNGEVEAVQNVDGGGDAENSNFNGHLHDRIACESNAKKFRKRVPHGINFPITRNRPVIEIDDSDEHSDVSATHRRVKSQTRKPSMRLERVRTCKRERIESVSDCNSPFKKRRLATRSKRRASERNRDVIEIDDSD